MEVLKQILNDKDVTRTIRRITHEIIEKNSGVDHLVFAGIETRGVPLAKRLIDNIKSMENIELELIPLDITAYRDDRERNVGREVRLEKPGPYNVRDKTVIIVDDVMYTGRTARAAMEAILNLGRPARVQLCVMVDRGHRELPIKADYVGKNIPTSKSERVHVHLKEVDGEDFVGLE